MAKNTSKQIEEDKIKIIDQLKTNSNKSINEIAKNCGFSRQKVWRIIKNLESDNTIWGYAAVTNEEKLNSKSYVVLIKRTNMPLTKLLVEKIIGRDLEKEAIKLDIDIISSIYTNGSFDWFISFNARNIRDAKRFTETLNRSYEGFIADMQLLETMFTAKKTGILNPEIEKLADIYDL